MREVGKNQHPPYWIAALKAKFEGDGPAMDRAGFDEFLAGYAGVSDYPAAIFPDELIHAYPDAQVILTMREEDKWYESMMATIIHAFGSINKPGPMRSMAELYHKHLWDNDFAKNGRARFREHNEHVKAVAPPEQLLVYEVKEGWAPLCAFLGKEIPEKAFPRSDDWLSYKQAHSKGA
ncbi:putative NAD dependent epimerase dehydratase protein [Coleophoma cylindrospora]|uniref:Putative NAD dependent epimerase dehydratase protein n=1 Tax=Coleophoma cylindrospora TaxID=1849047 RepID=A0A3D8QCT6_9HELO|nr:putative NAD dependent epimerase dehydratase protein [Coleophoma cylindrospora]